jgi:hypothetical protein
MKRMAVAVACAVVFVIGVERVLVARGADVTSFPVSFVITSANCSELPPGTTITGSGVEKSVTTTLTINGVAIIINSSHASGTATDQDGNTYVFQYSNDFRATVGAGGVLSGPMNDAFTLAGPGPARLSNGFTGTFSSDFATFFSIDPVVRSYGDPVDFVTGASHCDPL